jgi:Two component regulator propeller
VNIMKSRARWILLLGGLLTMATATTAYAQGQWRSLIRPYSYEQIAVEGDTLWCATREAGLVAYRPSDQTFSFLWRTPGGLASNALTALLIDRSGRMWLGTNGAGVSLWSPTRTTWGLLNAFDGLRSEAIRCLTEDPARDSIWIGTEGGIALWNGKEIAGTLPDGVNPSPFRSDVVTGIVVRSDSQFVATADGMYLRRPSGGGSVIDTIEAGLPSRAIVRLATDGVDVFALTASTVYRYAYAGQNWVATPGIGTIFGLQVSDGDVFASAASGVHRWTGAAWSLVTGSPGSSSTTGGTIAVATSATTLFGANRNGVYEQPAGGGAAILHVPEAPPGNNVVDVAVQGDKLYVNTVEEGFGRMQNGTWRNWPPVLCTVGCDTTFLAPQFTFGLMVGHDGRKWVACWGTAIEIFDDSGPVPQFTRPTWSDIPDPGRHTLAVIGVVDSSGGHWLGMDTNDLGGRTPIGLDYYDSSGVFVQNFMSGEHGLGGNGKIHALTVDHTGRIWVGHTGQGLQVFRPPTATDTVRFSSTVQGTSNIDYRGLAASGDTIWASTTSDMRWHSADSGLLMGSYTIPAGPAQLALNPIAVGTDGKVWLGTTNGLRVYNRDGTVLADFTTDNSPLIENEVRSIRVDKKTGVVWISTSGGLNRYDPFYTPPAPPAVAKLEVRPYPNPAFLTGIGATIRLSGNATSYTGTIYDLSGRALRRFAGAVDRGIVWDGRDHDGRVVHPGVYFIRVEAGGRASTARIVLLR